MFPKACIHGRFQILHQEHLVYFQRAAAKYGPLYIGLTALSRDRGSESGREATAQNPLTYWERVEMWRAALADLPDGGDHVIGPFPVERPELLPDYVPRSCICATTVRDAWNGEKVRRLLAAGYEVDVLFTDYDKQLAGTDVRKLIATGSREWLDLVPAGVAEFLGRIDIEARLRAGT